jgi:phosphate starvation-inducible PhoH-like protein
MLAALCGPLDANLRLIEARLGVELRRRGNAFVAIGAGAASAEPLLRELASLAHTEDITPEAVHLALRDHADRGVDAPAGGARRCTHCRMCTVMTSGAF